ncbi:pyruvate kinase [Acidaminococcus massiliensis]|jgi:pyruvate kinase|uniref:pyruvate kinase n=1 Tax=Acidaminococcus massiliensis TaxID=1852375 RepID=UPI00094ECC85|nr:pyruvate kinase [Acidaminococcus massiliensis]
MKNQLYKSPEALYQGLSRLRQDVLVKGEALYRSWRPQIQRTHFLNSALNMAFYLALRSHDLRKIQHSLLPLGLSSLGRGEARTITNLDAVMASLGRICQVPEAQQIPYPDPKRFFSGDTLLSYNTGRLFGREKSGTRIMVTLPTDAALDGGKLIRELVAAGMDSARINCAHDTQAEWEKMIGYIRQAEQKTGRRCRVHMDLAGPKVRIDHLLLLSLDARVFPGDSLFLVRDSIAAWDPAYQGGIVISCSIPEIFQHLKAGDPVLIDDGKIRAEVEKIVPQGAWLKILYARPGGSKLKNQKSLNFPQTPLDISPLTSKDLEDLDFVAAQADSIGYSFVKSAEDMARLQQELRRRLGRQYRKKAIIAKIETREAVHHLPDIIVQAASRQPLGIMIARGDLAVEVGWQRLAELQEEILWICEAAHVPVIWATQVLENLVRTGLPSRAEITDAAMGERAECVMLNKGPYIVEGVSVLNNILKRMESHQYKKSPELRALSLAKEEFQRLKTAAGGKK